MKTSINLSEKSGALGMTHDTLGEGAQLRLVRKLCRLKARVKKQITVKKKRSSVTRKDRGRDCLTQKRKSRISLSYRT
jgi:hypothetical protein